MNTIGKRISISEKDRGTSILIFSQKDKTKQAMMLTWLILWSIGGIFVIAQLFAGISREENLFLVIWLAFWVYFELMVAHAFLWRQNGFERIFIKDGKLSYRREIKGKGKIFTYENEWVRDLRLIDDSNENSFLKNLRQSYWVISGEVISFDYKGKIVKIGLQLEKNDAQKLMQLMEKKVK